ncbi:hypothetical protein PRUPE_8G170000 [Prunus persica]|uniref:Uncharacterized protein n=1 Tax=Prunus persica TaxID=3760 RepID=A0A251MZ27_PRUPE|nr:hypothetical protein PRUPE_8G170000 [Prunus persica]
MFDGVGSSACPINEATYVSFFILDYVKPQVKFRTGPSKSQRQPCLLILISKLSRLTCELPLLETVGRKRISKKE